MRAVRLEGQSLAQGHAAHKMTLTTEPALLGSVLWEVVPPSIFLALSALAKAPCVQPAGVF